MKIRNKYLLIMAAVWGPCLAMATASYALVLRPQTEFRRDLEVKIARAKELYIRAVEAAKPERQTLLAEQVDRLHDRIEDFLLDFEDASDLAFEIGDLARETRLESFSMKPASAQTFGSLPDREHLGEKRLNASFVAGFPRFAAFLNALERHHPVVFVETFTIDRPPAADAQPRVDMGLAVLIARPQGD